MRHLVQSHRCWSRVGERLCPLTKKKLKLKYWTLPCQERFKFGAGDPVVCKTAYFIPVLIHGACAIMRVSMVSGKLMLLIVKDTLKVLEARFDNIGIFPGAGHFEWKVLRESRANHLMVPSLSETFWEFHDSFVPSETAGPVMNETFSGKLVLPRLRHIILCFHFTSFDI